MKLLTLSSFNLFTLTNSILLLLLYLPFILTCGYPGSPAHANIKFSSDPIDGDTYQSGTFATYNCDSGYDLLGPNRRVCSDNGTWIPQGVPFCVLNVAVGKAAMQSSTVGLGSPQKAVDGSTAESFHAPTCTMTSNEPNPWWYVNLLEPYLIQLVRIDFGAKCCGSRPATVIVRVGNSRPDLDNNPICNKFTGFIEAGAPLFLPCTRPTPGAFVSVHFESGGQPLSICETFVYTDHALSIEQCPSFRDQPLGSTSTYNGKCYLFYNDKPMTFDNARRFCDARGGTLVDETSPALQGFLSWELYRRHRNDKYGQYWLGAVKDPQVNKWKWINGKEVQISFWSQPRTNHNCSRFDGTKGWLWADTNCNVKLHTVCSHRPLTCGRPEIPANATILFRKVDIGSMVEYRCGSGNLLVGPTIRTCLPTGFFSEYSPKCKYLECGFPASISNGDYSLVNKSRAYMSGVQYNCDSGFIMVGRSYLLCDIDGRWNGPPPRCEPIPTPSTTTSTTPSTTTSTTTTSTTSTSTTSTTTSTTTTSTTTPAPPSSPFYGSTRRNNITPVRTYYSSRDPSRRPPPQIALIPEISSTRPPSTTSKYLVRYTSSSSSSPPSSPALPSSPLSPLSPSSPSSSSSPTYSSSSPSSPPGLNNNNINTVTNNNKRITSPVYPTTLTPTTNGNNNKKQVVNSNDEKDNEIDDTIYSTSGSSSSSSASTKSANVKATATTKLNMGGIIALGVFGGFVFLAAIVTIIIIIVRRFKNSRNSIDAQTISTFDSSGDQSGFYRNYKESWENLKYVRHANSYKPGSGLGRLDAFDTAYRNPRSRNGGGGNGTVGVGGLCNEGFRDTGEITLNADVAALYSRPDKRFRGQY